MTVKANLLLAVAATGLALALFIGIGEVVLRALEPQSDEMRLGVELPHSPRIYGLKPNTRSLQVGVEVQTNALGFRDRDYPVSKPAGVRRIVVLGDSYAFGVGVELEDSFPRRLEKLLNVDARAYEVLNFGVGGYNTAMELATLREVAAAFSPDIVLVAYVLNDAELPRVFGERAHYGSSDQTLRQRLSTAHVRLKEGSALYRYLGPKLGEVMGLFGARYSAGKTREVLEAYDDQSPGWINSRQALLDIDREARAINARTLVVVFPLMVDFSMYPLTSIHEKIVALCRAHNIDVLDLLPRVRDQRSEALTVFLDGHPNAAAHRRFAEAIAAHVRGEVRHVGCTSPHHDCGRDRSS